jgi:hypothetical protein
VFVWEGRWRGRKSHLRRFARLALLHACICTSAPARLTNHPHLELPLHAIVQLHAAALSYPAESADASLESTIGLCVAQAQLTVCSVSDSVFWLPRLLAFSFYTGFSFIYESIFMLGIELLMQMR